MQSMVEGPYRVRETPPPRFARSPSPGNPWEESGGTGLRINPHGLSQGGQQHPQEPPHGQVADAPRRPALPGAGRTDNPGRDRQKPLSPAGRG